MAWAINIRSDDSSADAIRALWREFGSLEAQPSLPALNYPPHITLAVYDDQPEGLFEVFDRVFSGQPRQVVSFNGLGLFRTPTALVVYAAPADTTWLQHVHQQLHQDLDAGRCRPNYRPELWVAHCSLATAIDFRHERQVRKLVDEPIRPFDVTFTTADCAVFPPVSVIRELPLRGPLRH